MCHHTFMVLTKEGYKPRLIDAYIKRMLNTFGAICIEGPKWCGKTWTSLNHSNSVFNVGDKKNNFQNRTLAVIDPDIALRGEKPHLIDEWQEVPAIWDAVRSEVDGTNAKGGFILTGSSTPVTKGVLHSGAGRIGSVRMRTMSLFETSDSNGLVSLKSLFGSGPDTIDCGEVDLEWLVALAVRGGWPGAIGVDREDFDLIPRDYIEKARKDAARLDGKRRDSHKMLMLIKSLARNESTVASKETLKKDMRDTDEENISDGALSEYLDCLERIFLVDNIPAFSPNVRSPMRVGKSEKRHLADPSLAVAAMGMNEKRLLNDLRTFGFVFESLCEHDLRIYAEASGGKIYHYRDGNDNEIDAIVEMPDGSWGAFEMKLGTPMVEEASENLLRITNLLVSKGAEPPSVLCVICGMSQYAYRRPDGVCVVPITSLRD